MTNIYILVSSEDGDPTDSFFLLDFRFFFFFDLPGFSTSLAVSELLRALLSLLVKLAQLLLFLALLLLLFELGLWFVTIRRFMKV